MRRQSASAILVAVLLATAACSGVGGDGSSSVATGHEAAHDLEVVSGPADPVDLAARDAAWAPTRSESFEPTHAATPGDNVAIIGQHGHLGSLSDASIDDVWLKWQARPSPDRSTAVMTIQEGLARTLDVTLVSWVSLPDAIETNRLTISDGGSELNAVSHNGDLVALTNHAEPQRAGEIAGAKMSTTLRIADRDGIRYEAELDGNYVAEAFGRSDGANGLPDQIFLLEHIPADAPRFYRVRVLSTESGEISLPINIRNKSQQVDERMSGISRSQVIADEHGLLFTLYRGTTDGTPDGEPYAFVHTLDLGDGVWCLFLDPALELDTLAGSIAVGGHRLYVASANGKVGSIPIPSISDISQNPEMDWVVKAGPAREQPPVLLADANGVWIGPHDDSQQLIRLGTSGQVEERKPIDGSSPTALEFDASGEVVAAGEGWSTLGDFSMPDWFGAPAAVFVGQ